MSNKTSKSSESPTIPPAQYKHSTSLTSKTEAIPTRTSILCPKQHDLALAKCVSSDQSTTLYQSVSTLTSIQQTNVMGQEPPNHINNPSQVIIAIGEPIIQEANEDLEQHPNHHSRRKPSMLCCRQCGKTGVSVTKNSVGTGSWIIFFACLMVGCLMFAWIPLLLPECMDVKHFCPNCVALAGTNRYLLDG